MLEHVRQRQEDICKGISASIGGAELSNTDLEKSVNDYFEKAGKKAVIGETRTFGGREYIKTSSGWKFHGKGTGKKAGEHRTAALGHHVEQGSRKQKEEDFHAGYNDRNRKLKGYDVKDKKGNEHYEAGKRYAEIHHKNGLSDLPASAFEHYEESNGKDVEVEPGVFEVSGRGETKIPKEETSQDKSKQSSKIVPLGPKDAPKSHLPKGEWTVKKDFKISPGGGWAIMFKQGTKVRSDGAGKIETQQEDGTWKARKPPIEGTKTLNLTAYANDDEQRNMYNAFANNVEGHGSESTGSVKLHSDDNVAIHENAKEIAAHSGMDLAEYKSLHPTTKRQLLTAMKVSMHQDKMKHKK